MAVQSITPVDLIVFAGDDWAFNTALLQLADDGVTEEPLEGLEGATAECVISNAAGAILFTPVMSVDAVTAVVSGQVDRDDTDIPAQTLDYVIRLTATTRQTVQYGRLAVKRTRLS